MCSSSSANLSHMWRQPKIHTQDNLSLSWLGLQGGLGPAHFQEGVIVMTRRCEHVTVLIHHVPISPHQMVIQRTTSLRLHQLRASLSWFPKPHSYLSSFLPRVLALAGEATWNCWEKFLFCGFRKTSLWIFNSLWAGLGWFISYFRFCQKQIPR